MNRAQKEKSLHIKFIMRTSKWPMTYKEAKRELRRRERRTKRAVEFQMQTIKKIEREAKSHDLP